jgi:hypothetical protein
MESASLVNELHFVDTHLQRLAWTVAIIAGLFSVWKHMESQMIKMLSRRTRLTITAIIYLQVSFTLHYSTINNMETLAIAALTTITATGLGYLWAETKRPSL